MPYTQEQYQRAKETLKDPGLPEQSRTIRTQRIAEFESDQARGYQRTPEPAGQPEDKFPTLGEVDASFGPSYLANSQSPTAGVISSAMAPEQLEARRQAWEKSRDVTRDDSIKGASKLKVFNNPTEYDPPKPLPGMLGSALGAIRPDTQSYFEPTPNEFRQVVQSNDRVRSSLLEQYPDFDDPSKLPDDILEKSDAFGVYADARWQQALAQAMKSQTPITRVSFSDRTGGVDPNTVEIDPKTGKPVPGTGQRKLNLQGHAAHAMDSSMALMTGALQGGSMGLYDTILSSEAPEKRDQHGNVIAPASQGLKGLRDAGRGSRERSGITSTVGEVAGALDPRQLPMKAASILGKGISRLTGPLGLPGRVAASAGVGAATTTLDDNMRAAADLAADAMDADKTARETVLSIVQGLPGVSLGTTGLGAVGGIGAELAGAGIGAVKRVATSGRLREPLAHFEASGGQMGPGMGPRPDPEAITLRTRAEAGRTKPIDLVVEEARQPLARQRLKEQESAARTETQATNVSQAKLEGVELPTQNTADAIRAEAFAIPKGIPADEAAAKQLAHFASELENAKFLTADQLDERIRRLSKAAKEGKAQGQQPEHWEAAIKQLRNLRDELPVPRGAEDATVVTEPPDKGLFTADPDVTIAEPPNRQVAVHRDKYGNVEGKEGYSAEKTRQSRLLDYQKNTNKRLGLPETLEAESVVVPEVGDKGLFNVRSAKDVASAVEPNVHLDDDARKTFDASVRGAIRSDYSATRAEVDRLAQRASPKLAKDIDLARQLVDSDKLEVALGHAVDQLNNSGFANAGMLKRMGFRTIPTLHSLSGGAIGPVPLSPTKEALAKVKKFLPDWELLHLRGGKPLRVTGAFRDDEQSKEADFSAKEKEFWLRVIDQMTQAKQPQKVAGN